MPDTPGEGDKFAADLYELYEVARSDLQPLADLYGGFSRSVDQSNEYNLNPPPATGVVGRGQGALRSGSRLAALRDDIQYAFARSSQNIESAATTLLEVAENYANADEEIQADFEAKKVEDFPSDESLRRSDPPPPVYPDGNGNHPGQPTPKG